MSNSPVVVVTGSSKGIGRKVALELAAAGFAVIVHGRGPSEALTNTVEELKSSGAEAQQIIGDFANFTDQHFREFVKCALEMGGDNLVGWVNNAGADVLTGVNRELNFAEKLRLLYEVDVRSTLLLSREIAEHWQRNSLAATDRQAIDARSIVNVGWDQADSGLPGDSGQMFAASKGAIMAMTASLAQTYAPTVRVNCVAPGWIKTQWGESVDPNWEAMVRQQSNLGRWGTAGDIASTVRFLLTPQSSFINGQTIRINGGLNTCSVDLAARLKR